MKSIFLAGAAALTIIAAPAIAQDAVTVVDGEDVYVLTEEQTVFYDAWPYERQAAYDAWPAGVQEYYWTLDDSQSEGWWVLTDPQRLRVYDMTPEQRTIAWQQISNQMSSMEADTQMADTSATPQPRFVRSEVSQTTPSGYKAADSEDLPVCAEGQQDGCINSWEKNGTGNRPIDYWPGRPASEIDGPLPATQAEFDSMTKVKKAEEEEDPSGN